MNIKPYKFLYDIKILYSIQNLPYMVIGPSMLWEACDKIFLNGHIWSLDHQCHGKHITRFS